MAKHNRLKNYNEEPITYCSRCYSLKIVYEDMIQEDCCGECGCSDLKTTSIEEWEKIYEERYGHKYIDHNNDIRKSPIFLLSLDKLKTKVYKHSEWKEICKTMYPAFPEGISKSDSVVLLFAKLCNDNKLDDLRMELVNREKRSKLKS